jgi:Caspase domain
MTYRALLVGNSVFDVDAGLQPLNAPVKDVVRLHGALVDADVGMFDDACVRVVTERSSNDILDELDRFFGDGEKDDVLLFYYSGHGVLDVHNQLYLCGRDTRSDKLLRTGISNTRINEFIAQSVCRRTVILLDCCSSGMFKGGPIGAQLAGPGRFIVSSTRGADLANDAASRTGTSLFTDSLIEGLLGGAPDSNRDGLIELREIYDYVRDRLTASSKQVPHSRFDGDATIAIARVHPAKRSAEHPPTHSWGQSREPTFDLAENVISFLAVGADEQLPREVVEVIRHTDAPLDLVAHTNDNWVHVSASPDELTITFNPSPGPNHAKIVIRDQASATEQTLRVHVFVRPPHTTVVTEPPPVGPTLPDTSDGLPPVDIGTTPDVKGVPPPPPPAQEDQASRDTIHETSLREVSTSPDARGDAGRGQGPLSGTSIARGPRRARGKRWVWLLAASLVVALGIAAFIVWAVPKPDSQPQANSGAPSPPSTARPSPSPTPSSPRPSSGKTYRVLHAPAPLYTDPNNQNSVHGQRSGTAALICARNGFTPNGTNGDDYWYYIGQNLWINDYNIDGHGNASALVNACEGTPPHAGSSTLPSRSNIGVPPPSQPQSSSSVTSSKPAPRCTNAQLTGTLIGTSTVLSLNVANAGSSCTLPEPVYLQLLDSSGQPIQSAVLSTGQTGVVLQPGSNNPALTSTIPACSPNPPSAVADAQTKNGFVNFHVDVVGSVQACLR